jgi:hypothetical protein
MLSHQSCNIIAIVLLLATVLIAPTRAVLSQGRAQDKPQAEAGRKVPAFKAAAAVSHSVKELPPPPRPLSLSPGVLAKLIGKEPGSLYVRLTPSQPKVVNRGALVFGDPDVVNCGYEDGEGWVLWHKKVSPSDFSEHSMMLWIRSSAGSKYVIDCAVSADSGTYKVVGPDHSGQIFDPAQENGHLSSSCSTLRAPVGSDLKFSAATTSGHSIRVR